LTCFDKISIDTLSSLKAKGSPPEKRETELISKNIIKYRAR